MIVGYSFNHAACEGGSLRGWTVEALEDYAAEEEAQEEEEPLDQAEAPEEESLHGGRK